MIIDLDGISITILRKRVKNINLRIQHTGDVHISAPIRISLDLVYRFLQDKRPWIDEHRSRLQAQPQESPQTLPNRR